VDLLKLQLQNFASYQNEEIDLQGIHVAGLLGPNGSGKSSFIESILWALYGESPKGGKRDADNFVRTGTDECTVVVDFSIGRHVYRVLRSWNKKERKGRLGFFVYQEDWEPRGKNAKESQAEIEKVLRMDYKTFVATVIQVQDKKTESFTDCSDADRKAILASILGLDTWERVAKIASDKVKMLNLDKAKHERDVEYYQQLAGTYDDLINEVALNNRELRNLEDQLKQVREALEVAKADLNRNVDLDKEYVDLIDRQNEIQNENVFKSETYNKKVTEQMLAISGVCDKIREQENKISELSEFIKSNDQAVLDCAEYEHSLQVIENIKPQVDEYHEAENQIKFLTQQLEYLSKELEEKTNNAELIRSVPCAEEAKRSCPLMQNAWECFNKIEPLLKERSDTKKKHEALTEKLSVLKPILDDYVEHESKVKQLSYAVDAVDKRNVALDNKRNACALLIEYQKLLEEKSQALDEAITEREEHNAQYQLKIQRIKDRLEEIQAIMTPQTTQEDQIRLLTEEQQTLEVQIENKRYTAGALRNQLTAAENAKESLSISFGELVSTNNKIELYKIIEKSAGKKRGVPSLIVENAIPEIEALANNLLARVSNERFSVRFETQMESKTTENVQDVLKIIVMDDGEARAFQTYSGAQRFILDFAIRVAISKFLAHRSGTEIKILIIDEGFSALDDINFPKVIEVINEIAQDFDKVLIVTHINKLKSLLPQKIIFSSVGKWTRVTVQGE
jgi:exonuclease SbcC